MSAKSVIPKWAWLTSCALFLIGAIVFQRVAALADGWFARLGTFAFTGILLDLGMVFLASFMACSMFLRRYGHERAVRRRLAVAYAVTFAVWTALSFLLIANMLGFAPVTLGLGGFALAEALLGAGIVVAAVLLRGRLFERNISRRVAVAQVMTP